jgi:CheY-like chemotaxis protein/signal transduction histidine kinase
MPHCFDITYLYNSRKGSYKGILSDRLWTRWGQRVDKLTHEEFEEQLRESLGYLHDPYRLRHSPLAALFGVGNRHDTPSALRRILTEAIEALEPPRGTPDNSRAWRMYESLYYRYTEQFSQEEVADQMGLSARQVRREQSAALEALAYQLWSQFRLDESPSDDRAVAEEPTSAEDLFSQELAWLRETPSDTTPDLQQVLPAVIKLAQPLADQRGVSLIVDPCDGPMKAAIDPVALRQILLHVLDLAIAKSPPEGRIRAALHRRGWEILIRLESLDPPLSEQEPSSDDIEAKLHLARHLGQMCGCSIRVIRNGTPFAAEVTVVGVAQIPVVIVDDNVGTLQLIQRYLQGTRYHPHEIQTAEDAVPMAAKLSPAVIVLDVMMPQVDGWEILGRLREHPMTRHIPVIVCTILAQKELALALGAAGFLRKPFTRQALLEELNQQVPEPQPAEPQSAERQTD